MTTTAVNGDCAAPAAAAAAAADHGDDEEKQHLFVIRHGDRWDYAYPEVGFRP